MEPLQRQTATWSARRLRDFDLLLWRNAAGQSALRFEDFVYHNPDLADLIGDAAYGRLVDRCIACEIEDRSDRANFTPLIEALQARLFPRRCLCRGMATQQTKDVSFSDSEGRCIAHVRLNFSDMDFTRTMTLLFRRTPDLSLLECSGCGDIWLQGRDHDHVDQHIVLLDREDVENLGPWASQKTIIRRVEEKITIHDDAVTTRSPALRDWQRANNTPESFALYADPCIENGSL